MVGEIKAKNTGKITTGNGGGDYGRRDEDGVDEDDNLLCLDDDDSSSTDRHRHPIGRMADEKDFDDDGMEDPESWMNDSPISPETSPSTSKVLSSTSLSKIVLEPGDTDKASNRKILSSKTKIISDAGAMKQLSMEKKDFKLRSTTKIIDKPTDEKHVSNENGVSVAVSRDISSFYMSSLKSPKSSLPPKSSPVDGNSTKIEKKTDILSSGVSTYRMKSKTSRRRNRRDYDSDDDDHGENCNNGDNDGNENLIAKEKNIDVKRKTTDLSCEKPTHGARSRRNRERSRRDYDSDGDDGDDIKGSIADEKNVSFKSGTTFKSSDTSTNRMKSRMRRRRNRRDFGSSDEEEDDEDEDDGSFSPLDGNSTHSQYSQGEATRATIDSELYNAVGAVAVYSTGVLVTQRPAMLTQAKEQEFQQYQEEVESQKNPTIDVDVCRRKDETVVKTQDRSIPLGDNNSFGDVESNIEPSNDAIVRHVDARVTPVSFSGSSDVQKKKSIDITVSTKEGKGKGKGKGKVVQPWYKSRILWIVMTAIVVIGVILGLVLARGKGSKPDITQSTPNITQSTPTMTPESQSTPTMTPETLPNLEKFDPSRSEPFIKYVIEGGVSNTFSNSTPQYKAFHWLMAEDEVVQFSDSMNETEIELMKTRYILAVFYYALNGESWTNSNGNWLNSTKAHCFWDGGVQCGEDRIALVDIRLNNQNLDGSIPSEIAHLSELHTLSLISNPLKQHKTVFNLNKLEVLSLKNTSFFGTLPVEIQRLSNLGYLDLSQNQLVGTLTNHFQTMSKLGQLHIDNNAFEGTLDDVLNCGNCSATLIRFISNANKISGSFPERLFNFSKLKEFRVAQLELTGTIPTDFGRLTALQFLDLRYIRLSNSVLPSEIGNMTNLKHLLLTGSTLAGTIPSELQQLTNLEILGISNTDLEGSIAMGICNIDDLQIVHSSRVNCTCPDKALCHLCLNDSTCSM